MDIYMLDINATMEDSDPAKELAVEFYNEVKEQVSVRHSLDIVTEFTASQCSEKLKDDAIVLVMNGTKRIDPKSSYGRLLTEACRIGCKIWPIGINKVHRQPDSLISEFQSYDVESVLEKRNLQQENIRSVAERFAREIIAAAMPTLYTSKGNIFISHRRSDGEDIAAVLCDSIVYRYREEKAFRDLECIRVGEFAQDEIDKSLKEMDVFLFLQTPLIYQSTWVLKELCAALIYKIPVIWIQIDDADVNKLLIKPAEKPNFQCNSKDFTDKQKLKKLADDIVKMAFDIQKERLHDAFYFHETMKSLLGEDNQISGNLYNGFYEITMKRVDCIYPQRGIRRKIELFARTPRDEDFDVWNNEYKPNQENYDPWMILTNHALNQETKDQIVIDSYDNYYENLKKYLSGNHKDKDHTGQEFIISGAFPNCDPKYYQYTVDAVITFASEIIKASYTLTFGSHPTFQILFGELNRKITDDKTKLNMYISKYFEDKYKENRDNFKANADLHECDEVIIDGEKNRERSLTEMRKSMIQRDSVKAMVCIGGMVRGDKSKEGVREEIRLAREKNIPVFVVGSVGGCSSLIANEHKADWRSLNDYSTDLNEDLRTSNNYHKLALDMLKALDLQK